MLSTFSAQYPATVPYPVIDPVFFSIGSVQVHWYGVAYVAGFLIAGSITYHLNKRWEVGLSSDDLVNLLLIAIVGVMLGGRLGYVIAYGGRRYLDDPIQIMQVWDGGMSFHGALVGIIIAGLLFARMSGVSFLRLADMAAVATPAGVFLGRLANFINGELWGRTTDAPWAMVFPGAGPLPRHPSQLYEALLEGLVMLAVLWFLARRKRSDGFVFGWFLLLYGVFRFAVEFVREPDVQLGFIAGWLTMGQILSLPLILGGAWLIWRAVATDHRSGPMASSTDLSC